MERDDRSDDATNGNGGNGEQSVPERILVHDPFAFLVDSMLRIEKVRVSTQVRQSHLKLQSKRDPETDDLLAELVRLETYLDGRIARRIEAHPAWPWASRVKGVGRENLPKIVGFIDISKVTKVSSVWKFAGFHVENGKAPKPKSGEKLAYNKQLRSMCWRLGTSLMKAKGCFYEYYLEQKEAYEARYRTQARKIVPTSQLPKEKGKVYEPPNMISEGHVHNQALRKMIKLFLSCLVIFWKEELGQPLRPLYVMEKLDHQNLITPEEMTDRPAKAKTNRRSRSHGAAAAA